MRIEVSQRKRENVLYTYEGYTLETKILPIIKIRIYMI